MTGSYHRILCFLVLVLSFTLVACEDDTSGKSVNLCATFSAKAQSSEGIITLELTNAEFPVSYEISYENGQTQAGSSNSTLTEINREADQPELITILDDNDCLVRVSITECEDLEITARAENANLQIAVLNGSAPYQYVIEYADGTRQTENSFLSEITIPASQIQDAVVTVTDDNDCENTVNTSAADLSVFTDSRDGQSYAVIKLGNQVWMKSNFNYETNGVCYENKPINCEIYGGLYTWETITTEEFIPDGWHIPSEEEFQELISTFGETAYTSLIVEIDSDLSFELGGQGALEVFSDLESIGNYWTSTEINENEVQSLIFRTTDQSINFESSLKSNSQSLRLVRDE